MKLFYLFSQLLPTHIGRKKNVYIEKRETFIDCRKKTNGFSLASSALKLCWDMFMPAFITLSHPPYLRSMCYVHKMKERGGVSQRNIYQTASLLVTLP